MKRKQLESLLTALIPTLRHFIERQITTATTQLRGVFDQQIAALPKPKDGKDGVDGKSVTIEDVKPLVKELMPKRADLVKDAVADVLSQIELPAVPTVEQVAEQLQPKLATADQIAELALAKLTVPTAQEVAALVPAPDVPKAEEIAKLVEVPAAPTLDQIVDAVMLKVKVPTAKEVAAEIPTPSVELTDDTVTREQVTEIVTSMLPSAKSIVDEVLSKIEIPELPELPQLPEIPTAEEIAKLCVPMLPEPPSVEEVVEALKHHIPAPIKGDKGDKGDAGAGVDMAAVEGIVTRFVESGFSKWALDFERRALDRVDAFLNTIEKPRDGIDGKDGYGFDDMQLDFDGERHLTITFARGDKPAKSFAFDLPIVIYRGVWKEDEDYLRGDSVTWDGCTWIAKEGNSACRPAQSDLWQLAVKKGRDGRDGGEKTDKAPRQVRVAPRRSGED